MQATANVALTGGHVWRGTSPLQGDPAVRAGFERAGAPGFCGSPCGSSVEFASDAKASSEFDLVVGRGRAIAQDWPVDFDLALDLGSGTAVDLDCSELDGTLTWRGNGRVQVGWSNNVRATDTAGTCAQVGARWPLRERFRLDAAVGHSALDDICGESHQHAQPGGTWIVTESLELRPTRHEADASAKRIFPSLAGSRVEVALQAAFRGRHVD